MKRFVVTSSLFAVCAIALGGCRSLSMPEFWPFPERERTTFITPAMRSSAIAEFGARSTGVDSPEQREITDQLARVGSSRVDLQACKLEYSIVSPK